MKRKYLLNYKECSKFRKQVVFNSLFYEDYYNNFMDNYTACIVCDGFIDYCEENNYKENIKNLFNYINYICIENDYIKRAIEIKRGFKL